MARRCLQVARFEAALGYYYQALDRQPLNWILMNEIALFLIYTLHDYRAGAAMARAALQLNPGCSPDLWNTYGDGCYEQGNVAEARAAYRRAARINPGDVRARYNLTWVLIRERRYKEALAMVADALALDETGEFYERLLKKQAEALGRLAQRSQQNAFLLANRISRRAGAEPAEPPPPAAADHKAQ
jgi:tetratricopeptide (TPR) repeat protein